MKPLSKRIVLFLAALIILTACSSDGSDHNDAGSDGGQSDSGDTGESFSVDGQRIYGDVENLADPSLEGRAPGTAGNEAAVQYVADAFNSLGLEPGGDDGTFLQHFEHPIWHELDTPSFSVDGTILLEGVDYDFKRYSEPCTGTGEMVFAGYGLKIPAFDAATYPSCPFPSTGFDELNGLDLNGNVVVMFKGSPNSDMTYLQNCPTESTSDTLAASNILALIEVPDFSPGTQPGFIAGYYVDPSAPPPYPVLLGNRDSIEDLLPNLSTWNQQIDNYQISSTATGLEASVQLDVETSNEPIPNVLGVVPGNDPTLKDEIVVVGAHLDHVGMEAGSAIIYQGADDNASGTAAMMELARGVASLPGGPARTIVFAAWNAEETGLAGSCHYVENPPFPLADTVAKINFDMVGSGDESGIIVINGQEEQNEDLMALMTASSRQEGLEYVIYAYQKLNQADHYCFFESGIPAITILSFGNHLEAHTAADNMDIITTTNLEISTQLAWSALKPLAAGTEDQFQ